VATRSDGVAIGMQAPHLPLYGALDVKHYLATSYSFHGLSLSIGPSVDWPAPIDIHRSGGVGLSTGGCADKTI
jgi:hypothetical protein